MPIKLPKAPFRRKSSGNVLDTIENPPATSSFRVLNRVDLEERGFHRTSSDVNLKPPAGKRTISSPWGHKRASRSTDAALELDGDHINGQNHSVSTVGASSIHYDNSTQPSSISSASQDDLSIFDKPSPALRPRSSMDQLKTALNSNKTFPFRLKHKKSSDILSVPPSSIPRREEEDEIHIPAPEPPRPTHNISNRQDDDEMDDNIFAGMAHRSSFMMNGGPVLTPPPAVRVSHDPNMLSANSFVSRANSRSPSPVKSGPPSSRNMYRTRSWETDASQRGFVARSSSPMQPVSPIQDDEEPLLQEGGNVQHAAEEPNVVLDALFASEVMAQRHGTPEPSSVLNASTQRTSQSLQPPRFQSPFHQSPASETGQSSNKSTPRPRNPPTSYRNPATNYQSYPDEAGPSSSTDHRMSRLIPQNGQRMMSPAEFKQYKERKERELQGNTNKDEDEPTYEDEEDEVEKKQQLAKQRKKQEAHLAVWRQQMRKVTGDLPERPKMETSLSTSDLFTRLGADDGDKISSDEDDDIPLGVLQAHGFPNDSRPPSKPTTPTPNVIRMASYPAPSGTTRNDPNAGGGGGGGSLPPFARGLPADPFVGANIVAPTNRQSMAFSNSMPVPGTQTRQISPTRQPLPVFGPPGGLIGVIAEEERARAIRRQSSNTLGFYPATGMPSREQSPYGMPPQPQMPLGCQPSMNPSMMSLQQPMPMPPTVEQAQAQAQMMQMQMQMQWMQQMIQMQGLSPGIQAEEQQQYSFNTLRPQSTFLPAQAGPSQSRPNLHSRNPSSLSVDSQARPQLQVNMLGAQPKSTITPVHAPSIAPSERSNIGQPSRYRPVSSANMLDSFKQQKHISNNPITQRESRMSANTSNTSSRLSLADPNRLLVQQQRYTKEEKGKQPIRTPQAQVQVVQAEEEDEEEGWAQMKRRTQERKEKWRVSRNLAALMPGLPAVGGGGGQDGVKVEPMVEHGIPEGAYAHAG